MRDRIKVPLEDKIKNLIQKEGPITFARFMEMALFDPEGGYYSRSKAAEDYYTSPSAHPAFGALLALQLEQMWEIMGRPGDFAVVEVGAGRGLLAEDILDFLSKWNPAFWSSMRYVAVERGEKQNTEYRSQESGVRGQGSKVWSRESGVESRVSGVKSQKSEVRSHNSGVGNQEYEVKDRDFSTDAGKFQLIKSDSIPLKGIKGCFLSNELVDSFPVHRLVKKEGYLREIYVGLKNRDFKEITRELASDELDKYLVEQGVRLEEEQTAEINIQALAWLQEVASSLKAGYVITMDYGHEASILYSQRFHQGTLLCYYQHNYTDNPYIKVGQQDITSHVNFTALMKEGERIGLKTLGLVTQSNFLHNLGLDAFFQALAKMKLGQKEYYANQMALRYLASSHGTGDFKVLVQGKNVSPISLYGLTEDNGLLKRLEHRNIPLPLLNPKHLSLLQGAYPEYYF